MDIILNAAVGLALFWLAMSMLTVTAGNSHKVFLWIP